MKCCSFESHHHWLSIFSEHPFRIASVFFAIIYRASYCRFPQWMDPATNAPFHTRRWEPTLLCRTHWVSRGCHHHLPCRLHLCEGQVQARAAPSSWAIWGGLGTVLHCFCWSYLSNLFMCDWVKAQSNFPLQWKLFSNHWNVWSLKTGVLSRQEE